MKKNFFRFAAAGTLAAGMIFAQTQPAPAPAPGNGQWQHKGGMRANRLARMAQYLNLTDAQKAQAKTLFQQARQSAQPVQAQLKQQRQAMRDAIKNNDTAAIDRISNAEAPLLAQLIDIRTKAMASFYQTLTPEQRQKADQLPAHFRQMMHNRMHTQRPANS